MPSGSVKGHPGKKGKRGDKYSVSLNLYYCGMHKKGKFKKIVRELADMEVKIVKPSENNSDNWVNFFICLGHV
jgi:hypothetical protein